MRTPTCIPTLAALLCLASPIASFAKDHDDRDRDHDRDHHSRSHITHRVYPHSYGYPYGYYGYPYYYGRPSLSFSFGGSRDYYDGDELGADVQRALKRRGYYRGPIDGDIGPGTREAIRHYQYDNDLRATGRIDSSLLRALRIG